MGSSCCCPSDSYDTVAELEQLVGPQHLTLRILTWNVGARLEPGHLSSLKQLMAERADIMVIGLQEIVDLNGKNMVMDDDTDAKWDNMVSKVLNSGQKRFKSKSASDKYHKLSSIRLMGVLLMVYVTGAVRDKIVDLKSSKIGTGILGAGPNKGAVAVRWDLFDTSMVFICAHLAAQKAHVAERNDNFHRIMNKLAFGPNPAPGSDYSRRSQSFLEHMDVFDHDYIFFFGDLNYRLQYDENDTVFELIEQRDWNTLLSKDQLLTQRSEEKAFVGFEEQAIEFAPTYKFAIGKNEYDRKKARTPSWCDRILWKVNEENAAANVNKLKCVKYDSFDNECRSDHKPVVAAFELDTSISDL